MKCQNSTHNLRICKLKIEMRILINLLLSNKWLFISKALPNRPYFKPRKLNGFCMSDLLVEKSSRVMATSLFLLDIFVTVHLQ